MPPKMCSYCGQRPATDREHVFPRNLYPESKASSRVQRLTIPACNTCNNSWSDDEVHFRNVVTLPDHPNQPRTELWNSAVRPSLFEQPDGLRRARDLVALFRPVEGDGELRYKIYPAEDPRVVRVVKKIVRGLSHYHRIETAVPESRVWVDVLRYPIQKNFLSEMAYHHRETDIAEYRHDTVREYGMDSAWLITFFQRVTFLGIVFKTESALAETTGTGTDM